VSLSWLIWSLKMRSNLMYSGLLLGMLGLIAPGGLAFSSAGGVCSDQYQEKLRELRKQPPLSEYFTAEDESGRLYRRFNVWAKMAPAIRVSEGNQRRITVFLEDTAGNRIRTLPNELLVAVSTPARLRGEARNVLVNGEVTFDVVFPAQQQNGQISISPEPSGAGPRQVIELPLVSNDSLLLRTGQSGGDDHLETRTRSFATSMASRLLPDAREMARSGRRYHAQRIAFTRAQVLLEAGLDDAALEAFRLGAKEYGAPMCAWGEGMLLWSKGSMEPAKSKLEEVRRLYPGSVPASFTRPVNGEMWFVPIGDYLREIQAKSPKSAN
jgi:hypothetical protein